MTQTIPNTPSAGQQQEYREEFHVMSRATGSHPLCDAYYDG
jgi:hypothetical protein